MALALLARPLRRSDLLLGRWLGLAVAVVGYTIASGALAIGVVSFISGFGPPEPVLAIAFLAAQALVLLTLTLALGTVLPAIGAGAIAVVAFGIGWMAGVMAAVAAAFDITSLAAVAEASRWLLPSDGLWRGVVYGLEPPLAALVAVGRGSGASRPTRSTRSTRRRSRSSSGPWPGSRIVLALAAWRLSRRDL